MEFYIAWYPLIKAFTVIVMTLCVFFLVKYKWKKTAIAVVCGIILFMILAPVKIDGIQGKKNHKEVQAIADMNMEETLADADEEHKVVVTEQLTFAEKLKAEEIRSAKDIKEIENSIKIK